MKKNKKFILYFFIIIIVFLLIFEIISFLKSERAEKLLDLWAIGQNHIETEKYGGY